MFTINVLMDKYNYFINDWLLDASSGAIIHSTSGEARRLGEYQFRLLMVLAENAGTVLSREELTSMVWARRVIGSNSLPNAIHALRIALNDDGKNQRIIKTIPRKGYILASDYCRKEAPSQPEITPAFDVTDKSVEAAGVLPVAPAIPIPIPEASPPRRYRVASFFTLSMVVMIIAIISLGFRLIFVSGERPPPQVDRSNENVFSHIQWYGVVNPVSSGMQKENLFSRLSKTLSVLNQELAAHEVTMSVYYQVLDQTLDYSFVLRGPCEKKELVMVIHQWRVDEQRLNDLILNETRRKLSEMATCDKN